jgi:hypothetical protein
MRAILFCENPKKALAHGFYYCFITIDMKTYPVQVLGVLLAMLLLVLGGAYWGSLRGKKK